MWLVTGIDEEHRFPDWVAAAAFYRQIVEDWVARNGGPDRCGDQARRVQDLPPGGSQEVEFTAADGSGETVRFALSWDIGGGRTDHFVAC